jgi:hypothetical protein
MTLHLLLSGAPIADGADGGRVDRREHQAAALTIRVRKGPETNLAVVEAIVDRDDGGGEVERGGVG